ncbi:MAG: methylated-DNA--[protein]-cysteine S-methyltransferase [Gammaproteobacteria bacterium]|nr:methylated-DNA--[protein]-cysteine S-methyltransferase [Gammaproteobacteria bacterium]
MNNLEYQAIMTSPIGRIGVCLDETDHLVALDFLGARGRSRPARTLAARRIVNVLLAYFSNPQTPLHLPLIPKGTAHQQKVWCVLQSIPVGTVCSYGDLAKQIASSPRAVGQACRNNPIPILIPCHRVVARTGAGGYSGATSGPEMVIKRWLLEHEGVPVTA